MWPAVSSWAPEAQVDWYVNPAGLWTCSQGKPSMPTKSVLQTAQWGSNFDVLKLLPPFANRWHQCPKVNILHWSWNRTCELSLEGTKQEIKRNISLCISYYKISVQKIQNSSVDFFMWTFYYHLCWTHPGIQGHHEAASSLPLSCLFLSSFVKPLLYSGFLSKPWLYHVHLHFCTFAHLLMFGLLSGMASLILSSYIQIVPFINFQIKSYLLEATYEELSRIYY